ncbi:Lrp/AsnC family transcriptional regulator [Sphingomonas hankookensis]|uniref:Lrp/AsnC family transcriptional regulator n=1 Tax=Sphingomonas hankookensis TaxID=563996 RepID=UPI003D301E49
MDKIDRQILDLLQADGSLPIVEIARQVGLTKVPCWKRVDRLKKAGVIARFTAIVDKKTVGNIFTYFLTVESPDKTPGRLMTSPVFSRDIPRRKKYIW